MLNTNAPLVRFGVFEVDLQSGELRKAGRRIALQDQPFRVLVRLLEHPGQVVTRDELRADLWPADTFVDFEQGLNGAVKRLREALGDSADSPRYIETLARRGYRFIGTLSATTSSSVPSAITRIRVRNVVLLLLIGAASGGIVSTVFLSRRSPEHLSLAMPGRTVFTCGSSSCLATAADGSGAVFQGADGAQAQLYWQNLRGPGTWVLTSEAGTPFLSPDNRWLGFSRNRKIWKLPLQDGRVMEGTPATEICGAEIVRGATWGEDGTIIFAKAKGGLWRVSASGGEARPITQIDQSKHEASHRFPVFLPGSRAVLFQIDDESWNQDRSAIAVMSLETGRWSRLIEGGTYARYLASGYIVYARFGSIFAVPFNLRTLSVSGGGRPVLSNISYDSPPNNAGFDVARDGTLVYVQQNAALPKNALVWVDTQGTVGPVAPELRAYVSGPVAISPDGRRVAVAILEEHYANIWVYDLQERRWQRLAVQADSHSPVWSPGGDRIAFTSNRDGPYNIYVMRIDQEASPERLTSSPNQQWSYAWSPDGRFLAYQEQDPNPAPGSPVINTWILPLENGGKPRLLEKGGGVPAFSPDGRWMLYTSMTDSTLYVRPLLGGPRQLVLAEGGDGALWSRDGPAILYVERPGGTRIMSRRVESFSPFRLRESRVAFALPFSLPIPPDFISRTFAVSPDGTRIIVVRPDESEPTQINTLQVIRNWGEEVTSVLRR